jgi:hypothetical protein
MTQTPTPAPTGTPVNFNDLRKVNVNEHIEKKNGLSYLSWAYAVDELLQRDPSATWEYRFGIDAATALPVPFVDIGGTAMVFCTVNAFGVSRTAQLPVIDHRNKPITNPDAFQINTSMQRCLAKAIALHGLGLYIYAGEDLPDEGDKPEPKPKPEPKVTAAALTKAKEDLANCESVEALRACFSRLSKELQAATTEYSQALAKGLE